MAIEANTDGASPYQFLHAYRDTDRDRFFAREAETQILLADILTGRIVVLFAKTGTGKTSLIDAGVRPILEDRLYATFRIRVSHDPVASARAELRRHPLFVESADGPFAAEVEAFAQRLKKPPEPSVTPRTALVLFFDQFEEFFLYVAREDPAKARQFVADVARLYQRTDLGIHLVFSMREEFFADMELFRDEIPTIFHKDSNLRLRWFDKRQARTAILRPAACVGVSVERDLVHRLVADLSAIGAQTPRVLEPHVIEPAELQIVCDTLWASREDGRLTLAAYLAFGTRRDAENVAERILEESFRRQFEQIGSVEQLELLEQLLPQLYTDRGTKWVRDLDGLRRDLAVDEASLRELLGILEEARLINHERLVEAELVELSHDYLVERLDDLGRAIRLIWPRGILDGAVEAFARDGSLLSAEEVQEVVEKLDELDLSPPEAEIVLRSALLDPAAGVREALAAVEMSGADPWPILHERLERGNEVELVHAVEALGQLRASDASTLLADVLVSDEATALRIVDVLGHVKSPLAVELLARALDREALAPRAQTSLARLASSFGVPAVADAAADVLKEAIEDGPASPEAEEALLSLASSRHAAVAARALPLLGQVESVRAVRILEQALAEPALAVVAAESLRKLTACERPDVAAAAKAALGEPGASERPRAAAPEAPPALIGPPRSQKRVSTSVLDSICRRHAKLMLDGRVVPFLGAGANLVGRPEGADWQPAKYLPGAVELSRYLAERFDYPVAEPLDLMRVTQYMALVAGTGALYDELHDVFGADYPPTALHDLLAELPRLVARESRPAYQLILTANYDDTLESAFRRADEPYDLVYYAATGDHAAGTFWHQPPGGEPQPIDAPHEYRNLSLDQRTVIVKLYGSVNRHSAKLDSYVVTEDDFIDYLTRTSRTAGLLPAPIRAKLVRSSFLFLGYGLRDWSMRAFLHQVWAEQRLSSQSWAIMRDPSPLDQAFWQARRVEMFDVSLEEYLSGLRTALEGGASADAAE